MRSRSVTSDSCDSMDCSPPGSFSRQEYWSGLPFLPPGDLPDPEVEPVSPRSPSLASGFLTTEPCGNPIMEHGCRHSHKKKKKNTAIHRNMDGLENITPSETSQKKKDKYCMLSVTCAI